MTSKSSFLTSGFTLVELLIYMGVWMVMLLVLTELFSSTLSLRLDSTAMTAVEQDTQFLLSRITYDVSRANAIVTPAGVGVPTSGFELEIGGDRYIYQLTNTNLTLTNQLGTSSLNGHQTKVTNLTVTRVGNVTNQDSLQIIITLESLLTLTGDRTERRTLQTTVGLRQP